MSMNYNPALRQTIATLLEQEAVNADGARTLPEAAVRVCGRLERQLAPLISEGGVAALAARSLHLAQREFPCLAEVPSSEPSAPFAQLGPCLARQEPSVARDAAVALLATFTELLGTLVGEGLTARLTAAVWSSGS